MRILIILLFISFNSFGQDFDYGNSSMSIQICNKVQELSKGFTTDKDAINALDRILSAIGASKTFILSPCDEINNAVALSIDGERYIFYDRNFMKIISENSNSWSNISILAHEVGHHINGHTRDWFLGSKSSEKSSLLELQENREQELEADYFSGFVLGKLGATLNEASEAIGLFSSDEENRFSTHPSKSRRLAAIAEGYRSATEISTTYKIDDTQNKSPKKILTTSVRCSANTKEGLRCKNKTKNASGKCWRHE